MEIKKVKDLTDKELTQELDKAEKQLHAEYSILNAYRSYRKELIEELELRFIRNCIKNGKEETWIFTKVSQK